MVKVKLLVSRSGPDGSFAPGDEIEVSANEAKRMIERGQAEPVRNAAPASRKRSIERAIDKPAKEAR